MGLFKRKTKDVKVDGLPDLNALDLNLLNELMGLSMKYRITRLDFVDDVIEALFEIIPELKTHPKITEFYDRELEYKKETEKVVHSGGD